MARLTKTRKPKIASSKATKVVPSGPDQFNWARHWSKKVAPYLKEELVQASLDIGMRLYDPTWKRGDAPCDFGAIGFRRGANGTLVPRRAVEGDLSWYQPLNRCHYIAFFAMAIGVLHYPDLDWRFVSGDMHTVPVGYDANGQAKFVMDILLFEEFTADESIAHTQAKGAPTDPEVTKNWEKSFQVFVTTFVPLLKAQARQLRERSTAGVQPRSSRVA